MTPNDAAALARLVHSGRAVVVKFKGHWLCAGEALAQVTVRRLISQGLAAEQTVGVLVPTERGIRMARSLAPGLVRRTSTEVHPSRPPLAGQDPVALEEPGPESGNEPWAPPDVRDDHEKPLGVDVAFSKYERRW